MLDTALAERDPVPNLEKSGRQSDTELLEMRVSTLKSEIFTHLQTSRYFNYIQHEAIVRLRGNLSGDQVIDSPTRSGKSELIRHIAEQAQDAGLRVAILTHRKLIVEEHVARLGDMGVDTSSLFGDSVEQVTVDTIGRFLRNRPGELTDHTDGIDLLLIDEAHRALGEITRSTINATFPSAVRIAFTATPDYSEDRSVTDEYGDKLVQRSIVEAIQNGIAAPLRAMVYETDAIIDDLDKNWADFSPRDQKRLAHHFARNNAICEFTEDLIKDGRQGLISTIPGEDLLHADILAKELNSRTIVDANGVKRNIRAAVVGGSRNDSKQILEDYELGIYDVVLYCDLLTEGYSTKRASFFINGSPTTSIVKLTQQLGRIMEPKGRDCVAIDFIDISKGKKQRTLLEVLELDRSVQGVRLGPDYSSGSTEQPTRNDTYLRGLFRHALAEKLLRSDNKMIVDLIYTKEELHELSPYQKHLRKYREDKQREFKREHRKFEQILNRDRKGLDLEGLERLDYFGLKPWTERLSKKVLDDSTGEPALYSVDNPFVEIDNRYPIDKERLRNHYAFHGAGGSARSIMPVIPSSSTVRAWDSSRSVGRLIEASTNEVEDEAVLACLRADLDNLMDRSLDERSAEMLRYRLGYYTGETMTLEQTAEHFGLTRERIRQIESESVQALRHPIHEGKLRAYIDKIYQDPFKERPPALRAVQVVSKSELSDFNDQNSVYLPPISYVLGDVIGAYTAPEDFDDITGVQLDQVVAGVLVNELEKSGINRYGSAPKLVVEIVKMVRESMLTPKEEVQKHIDSTRDFALRYRKAIDSRYFDQAFFIELVAKRFIAPMLSQDTINIARAAIKKRKAAQAD